MSVELETLRAPPSACTAFELKMQFCTTADYELLISSTLLAEAITFFTNDEPSTVTLIEL